ncbi:hypothetical protein F6453_0651 [Marinobacter nauticus]|uniref:Uncharacterized protein n=1 Tax=Marinobacter nauticus TaxID=2743 RepID=A0A833JUW4_MARNT|nr:hypothetical protein F6453_0651 [Marinobacter nauticus]
MLGDNDQFWPFRVPLPTCHNTLRALELTVAGYMQSQTVVFPF